MNRKTCQIPSFVLRTFIVLSVFLMILLIIQTIAAEIITNRITKTYVSPEEERKWPEDEMTLRRIASSDKKYLPDGTLHLITAKPEVGRLIENTPENPYSWRGLGMGMGMRMEPEVEIRDSRDTLLWSGPQSKIPFTYLVAAEGFYAQGRYPWMWYNSLDPKFSREVIFPVVNEKRKPVEYWRYNPRKGYFTGYDRNKKIIGCCSAAGFTETRGGIQPFDSLTNFSAWTSKFSFSPRAFLLTELQLYEVNFENRSLVKLFDSQSSKIIRVHTIGWRQILSEDPNTAPAILVQRKNQPPVLIRKDPLRTIVLQVSDDLLNWGNLSLLSSGHSFYLESQRIKNAPPHTDFKAYWAWLNENRYKPREYRHELYQIQEDGGLVHLNQFEYIEPAYPPSAAEILYQKTVAQIEGICSFSAPPCLAWMRQGLVRFQETRNEYVLDSYLLRSFAELLEDTYPKEPRIYYPTAVILMILALVHALPRRTSWGKLTAWLVFIFCFNLGGFLTYLSLSHYPVIRCAACGRRRGLNRPDCPACGATLPPPKPRDVDLIYPPSPETAVSA
jgi:hypothetical protein